MRMVLGAITPLVLGALLAWNAVEGGYVIREFYQGQSFFDHFDFFTGDDPTHGYVNYVDRNTAQAQGLIASSNYNVYIGADHDNVAGGRGRSSVRLSSKTAFNDGLVIADIAHMPEGCGAWPALWLLGPNWPNGGEIDIIEGVNVNTFDQTTLHTNDGCSMASMDPNSFTGKWAVGANGQPATNCWVNAPGQYGNQGCGIICPDGTYGAPFNQAGGGVFVTEFGHGWPVKVWFFPRNRIPGDIQSGNPVPSSWGKPVAQFNIGNDCPQDHFHDMQIIINLTFCGDWAGSVFGDGCGQFGNCNDYVQHNPGAFGNAYWIFNSVKVYNYQ
jgi:hypothetical protein